MAVVKEQRQFSISPIGVARASEGGTIVGKALSDSANQLADIFLKAGAQQAEKRGFEAGASASLESIMTLDPATGKPEAINAAKEFGQISAEAYERVIRTRYQKSLDDEITAKGQELAVKYEQNSNGAALFETAMADYIASMSNVAESEYRGYIQDTGTAYLQATRSNLAVNQVRREIAAFAREQENTINDGLTDIVALISQQGPKILGGPSEANFLSQSLDVAVSDAVNAGVFEPNAFSAYEKRKRLAFAQGLVNYATSQSEDPSDLSLLQYAIGTGNPNLVPKGFEYIGDAMRDMVLDTGSLADFESYADGVLSDAVQYASIVQQTKIDEQRREAALRAFDIVNDPIAAGYNIRVIASNPDYNPSDIFAYINNQHLSLTEEARQALARGDSNLSDAILKRRGSIVQESADALYTRAVDGLSTQQVQKLIGGIDTDDYTDVPDGAIQELLALNRLDKRYGLSTVDGLRKFANSYLSGDAKVQDRLLEARAETALSQIEGNITSIDILSGPAIGENFAAVQSQIASIENLNPTLREKAEERAFLGAAKAHLSDFFATRPTLDQSVEASEFIAGRPVKGILTEQQVNSLQSARDYATSGKVEAGLRDEYSRANGNNAKRIASEETMMRELQNADRLRNGGGDPSSEADRQALDKIIERSFGGQLNGRSMASIWGDPRAISDPSLAPFFDSIKSMNVMPESLRASLSNLSIGAFSGSNPNALLSHYMNYRQYLYEGVVQDNPMMRALKPDQIATLDYLVDAASVLGNDPSAPTKLMEILNQRKQFLAGGQLEERATSFFGGSVQDFVQNLNGISEVPPSAVNAMTSAALSLFYLAPSEGLDSEYIKDRLERQIAMSYPDGGGVVYGEFKSRRTNSSISFAVPGRELAYLDYVTDQARAAIGKDLVSFSFNGPANEPGMIAEDPRWTTIYLKPYGSPIGNTYRYVVMARRSIDEGGDYMVTQQIEDVIDGDTVKLSAPLIVSNQDTLWNFRRQIVIDREQKASLDTANRKLEIKRQVGEFVDRGYQTYRDDKSKNPLMLNAPEPVSIGNPFGQNVIAP